MTRPTFNLVDEPWIGAVDTDGLLQEYSLRDLLVRAHELSGLYDDSPLVVAALLRTILALLHRVYDGPRNRGEWQTLWQAGQFDANRLDAYFAEWKDRFDLFSDEHPFYQMSPEVGQLNPVSTLVPEAASGFNATLFDHQTELQVTELPPSAAARSVLVSQYFSLGGGQSGIRGRNFRDSTLARGVLFYLTGTNLFQTLLLNLVPYSHSSLYRAFDKAGAPAWEQENPMEPDRTLPDGYLDYLTWQSRWIKLVPTNPETTFVKNVYRSQGLILERSDGLLDPIKSYKRYSDDLGIIVWRKERSVWRDSEPLLRLQNHVFRAPASFEWAGILVDRGFLSEEDTLRYMALGQATESGKATVYYFRSEHLPLPLAYFRNPRLIDSLSNALKKAESVASTISLCSFLASWVYLFPNLQQKDYSSFEDIAKKMTSGMNERSRDEDAKRVFKLHSSWGIERRYWAMLEPQFRATMQAIPPKGSEAIVDWFGWLRRVAWHVFDEVSDGLGDDPRALKAVVRGREQLARGLGKVLKIEE